jgi:23S rRNA (adenine2030-N6)-methyltransferase
MNYRHAFHAGNFADVFKHIVLSRILVHLCQKPAPFRVIDTHAGAGLYDLASEEAIRTGEWRGGIGRLAAADGDTERVDASSPAAQLLAPYLAACRADPGLPRYYPGSPLIALRLMRPQDRLIACEVEPSAVAVLARHLHIPAPQRCFGPPPHPAPPAQRGGKKDYCGATSEPLRPSAITDGPSAAGHEGASGGSAKVVELDGWTALAAYVPPKERRGLVLVDPPYEHVDEFARLAGALVAAHRKWPTGIYLLWYPIKDRDGPDHLRRALNPLPEEKRLRAEISIAVAGPQAGLSACGLIVLNPPWTLASELAAILPELISVLGRGHGRGSAIDRLEGEPRYRCPDNFASQG